MILASSSNNKIHTKNSYHFNQVNRPKISQMPLVTIQSHPHPHQAIDFAGAKSPPPFWKVCGA